MSASIEQLKNNINKTIQEATALLQKGILHLETKEYTYVSEGELPRELGSALIQFILFCRLIEKKKNELEKLKTDLISANSVSVQYNIKYQGLANSIQRLAQEFETNKDRSTHEVLDRETAKKILTPEEALAPIDEPNTQKTNFSEDLHEPEKPAAHEEKSRMDKDEAEEEEEDWAAEADAEAKEKIAKGIPLFNPEEFGKLVQLDKNNELEESKQREQPQKPTSAAMKYLQKRQAEAPDQTPVSNTPTAPSSDSKKRKRDW